MELKKVIIDYAKEFYGEYKKAPSIRQIITRFKAEKLNRSKLYKFYPGGLAEVCRLAGIPVPERLANTQMALKARMKAQEKKDDGEATISLRFMLTEEQTKRLLAISHLEGGKDPLLIIDELLDRDAQLRKRYGLKLRDTKLVSEFLGVALQRGWATSSNPNIVNFVTHLWNCGIQNLPPETVSGLISLLNDLRARRWNPSEFVKEATDIHNAVYWYRQYKAGYISAQEFKQKVAFML
ncbi:MAG: TusE/DsrC/DsvC family sulfur relay protein [Candidatus Bathyarchaeia archaeon]